MTNDKVHIRILEELIANYDKDMQLLLIDTPDYSLINYKEKTDKSLGYKRMLDANYGNRYKVLVAIFYSKERGAIKYENLIRYILQQEIIARRKIGGGSDALRMAILLLRHYKRLEDEALFKNAKCANFDTDAGMDIDEENLTNYFSEEETLAQFTILDSIYLAEELEETDIHNRLVDIWIANQATWDKENLSTRLYLERDRGNKEQALIIEQQLADLNKEEENDWDFSSTMQRLANSQLDMGKLDDAYLTLQKILPRITRIDNWQKVGLGRFILEDCINYIKGRGYQTEESKELWLFVEPNLDKARANMAWNLLESSAMVAEQMGNHELSGKLREQLEKKSGQYK